MLLLNVWATWCAPCRDEMPALDRLQQRLGGPGFEVVALSIKSGGVSAVKRFYGEIGRRTGPAEWDGPEAVRMIASYLGAKSRDR